MRILFIAGLLCCMGCGKKATSETPPADADSLKFQTEFTCPVHPEVLRHQEGKCPDCGRELGIRS